MPEVDYLLFHALVLLGILGGHHAVFIGVFIQKSPGLIPDFGALLTHFKNFAHVVPPKLSVVRFNEIQPSAQLICGNAGGFVRLNLLGCLFLTISN